MKRRWYVPGVGIIPADTPWVGADGARYHAGWLDAATAADISQLNALKEPEYDIESERTYIAIDPATSTPSWAVAPTALDANAAIIARRISALWEAADAVALAIADHNSRARMLGWLVDPTTPAQTKVLIKQVQDALDAVWAKYAQDKQLVILGQQPTPFHVPDGLPSFWAIAASTINP